MKEYIEKETVLRYIEKEGRDGEYDLGYWDHNVAFQEIIKEIPAADVRPVARGIWEKQAANLVWNDVGLYAAAYKCNRCGELNIAETNFCPNCGADMREES